MARIKLTEHFYADEFTCNCGKCQLSDPKVVEIAIDKSLVIALEEVRLATGIPIRVNRGASCKQHHIDIYKNIYGSQWEKYIVWDSSHLVDEKGIFYGADITPMSVVDFYWFAMHFSFFRFFGVGWYKIKWLPSGKMTDNFIHADYNAKKGAGRFFRRVYNRNEPNMQPK